MEIENSPCGTVETTGEKVTKNPSDLNSSEDEGISLSHKPESAAEMKERDVQSKQSGGNRAPSTTKPDGLASDDSDDDDLNSRMIVGRRKPAAILSDDDDGSGDEGGEKFTFGVVKRSSVLSSDEEEDSGDIFKKRIQRRPAVDSEDSDSDRGIEKGSPSKTPWSPLPSKPAYKYNSDLFDAEMSDEEGGRPASPVRSPIEDQSSKKKKKERRPTLKERADDVRAIHSESQRMVRESELSLPYHRPKQRTLAEFLNRRKNATPPMSVSQRSIKMSMKNLDTLRLLEQKKKEVEEFYKSDSDLEDPDDGDEDWTPACESKDPGGHPVETEGAEESPSRVDGENPVIETKMVAENPMIETKTVEENTLEVLPSEAFEEDEDLPDLIIERTPRAPVDKVPEKPTGNPDEVKVSDDVGIENTARIDDKVNDSGIHSSVSSPLEELQSDVAMDDGHDIVQDKTATDEKMDCDEPDEIAAEEGKDYGKLPDMEENQDTLALEEAVKDVSLEGQTLQADSGVPSLSIRSSSEETADTPKFETPKLCKLAANLPDLDLSRIAMSTPKLSLGGEDEFIDLEDDSNVTPRSMAGVHDLMNRFVKHSNTKKKAGEKHQVNLSIVSKEKDAEGKEKLISSSVLVDVEAENEKHFGEPVPGAPMVLLKTALQSKIREKRERERIRKVKEKQFLESEHVMQDYHDDGTLPNEEDELTDQSETDYETESEPEENDIVLKDKKRKKSAYFDDEAEDDDDDGVEDDDQKPDDDVNHAADDEDSDDTVELPDLDEKDPDTDDEDNDRMKLQWEDTQDIKTALRSTDAVASSSMHSNADLFATQSMKKVESVDKDSMDSSFELFGSGIPAHQPGGGLKHRGSERQSESENDVGFLTPLTKSKSGLFDTTKDRDLSLPIENSQDLFNTSALADTSDNPSPGPVNLHLTPMGDSQFPKESRKDGSTSAVKLKLDFTGIETSQQEGDELIGLCSGKFTATAPNRMEDLCDDDLPPTQDINDLMGLCSGRFTSQEDEHHKEHFKMPAAFTNLAAARDKPSEGAEEDDELLDLCSGRFTVNSNKDDSASVTSEVVSHREDRTQDGDEEKDESLEEPEMIVDSSSDDDGNKTRKWKAKRKKRRRIIAFSDDEDAQDAIGYDDEENEIPRTTFSGFKDRMKGGIRSDFLENEAELSDSDGGFSEDEDERGEDEFEMNEADLEHYDENELRDQVGRAHLKTLLDSDKREVRLLQEMYLENGELHGEGRQRQFRWKNVDGDDDNEKRLMSDTEEVDEEETEDAEWRKERFEREKFLEEQKEKAEGNEAEVFKIGKKTLLRSSSVSLEANPKKEPLKEANPAPVPGMPSSNKVSVPNPYSIMAKRGSFLARDKNTLARIAELTKEKGSSVGAAKQTGNFIFQQLTNEEIKQKEESTKQLKKCQSLPSAKRMKRDRSFFSMDPSSQSSSIFSQLL